jgi:hypothetical protein
MIFMDGIVYEISRVKMRIGAPWKHAVVHQTVSGFVDAQTRGHKSATCREQDCCPVQEIAIAPLWRWISNHPFGDRRTPSIGTNEILYDEP